MFKNVFNMSQFGLVVDWKFHRRDGWVSIFAPNLVEAILKEFDPYIISSQRDYELCKKRVKYIVSMEPGWAAPKIIYDHRVDHVVAVMASDPHNKKEWLGEYVSANGIDYVLSQYRSPFFYHFPDFPPEKFVHFPWAVPDRFLSTHEITCRKGDLAIFGAAAGDAYDVRNWCRQHPLVKDYRYSGVENKDLSNVRFFKWLQTLDAVVAAGSSQPVYNLVTPKYFEIAASSALLVGQECADLPSLGFNEGNMLIFTKDNFAELAEDYTRNPERYLPVREMGRQLIAGRHLVSHRLKQLKELFLERA